MNAIFPFVSVFLALGCVAHHNPVGSSSAASSASTTQVTPLKCQAGETAQWMALGEVSWSLMKRIQGTDGTVTYKDVSRDVYVPLFNIDPTRWDPTGVTQTDFTNNARFDFCATAIGEARLERILVGLTSPKLRIIDPKVPGASVAGFSESVFGDTEKLAMDIPLQDGQHFRLRQFVPQSSGRNPEKIPALFFGIGSLDASGKVTPKDGIVAVGRTQFDVDPFGPCATYSESGAYLEQSTAFGDALLKTKLCVGSVGGDTFSYTVVGFTVSHPKLSRISGNTIANNLFSAEGPSQVKKFLTVKLSHHSTCDQLSLRIPKAGVLATTAAPWGRSDSVEGCAYLPQAPHVAQEAGKAQWILKFQDGTEEKGELAQRYFFDEEKLGDIEH